MATQTFKVCDSCGTKGHNGGVGEHDILFVNIEAKIDSENLLYWSRDLCSECRSTLQTSIEAIMGKSTF